MIWGWENIWFFALSLSVLILLILYLFKYKGELFFTQALFLWNEDHSQEKSSSSLTFRSLPLSFYLEAAALILMVCGGASLFVVSKENFPPAVVLINNAYSMTPQVRQQGEKVLREYFRKFSSRRMIFAICGDTPALLGDKTKKDLHWSGTASVFKAEEAVAWARENFPGAEICLVTDRVPENFLPGSFTLLCCGSDGDNIAIANAAVTEGRILLEIRSFSRQTQKVVLKVNSRELETFTLESNGSKLFNFSLETREPILTFRIESPGDQLAYDDEVTLINRFKEPVTYTLGNLTPAAKRLLTQVLENNPDFTQTAKGGELLFTSSPPDKRLPDSGNRFFFHGGKKSFLERTPPFFVAREELLKGLHNTGLVWAFAPGIKLPGRGIVHGSAGALMSVEERGHRKYDIHMNLQPEYSNPASLPFWPGLFSNLAGVCRRSRPGVWEPNVKSGEMISFNLSPGAEKVSCRNLFSGEFPAYNGRCLFQLERKGVYLLDDGKVQCRIAVNPHVTQVSDLRQNKSVIIPCKKLPQGAEYRRSLSWIFIAAALLLLAVDGILLGRRSRKV